MTVDKERHDYVEQSAEVVEALAVHRKRYQDIQEADRNVILEAGKSSSSFQKTFPKATMQRSSVSRTKTLRNGSGA